MKFPNQLREFRNPAPALSFLEQGEKPRANKTEKKIKGKWTAGGGERIGRSQRSQTSVCLTLAGPRACPMTAHTRVNGGRVVVERNAPSQFYSVRARVCRVEVMQPWEAVVWVDSGVSGPRTVAGPLCLSTPQH